MRILFVTAEAHPLARSGGLADVSSALPIALKRLGIDVRIVMPAYPGALAGVQQPRIETKIAPTMGVDDAAIISGLLPNSDIPVWLVHAPSLFVRGAGLYQDGTGKDWPDNAQRFAFLAKVAAWLAQGSVGGWAPDVVHANDWHAGLVPLYLGQHSGRKPASVFTIHNLAFQGNFPSHLLPALDVPEELFRPDGIEFYGQISFLKAAIALADKITTVSPTYAREVLTPTFGCGLDGALRARGGDFSGVLNGIDHELWDPAADTHLAQAYSSRDVSGKRVCKAELQREFGLDEDFETPVIGFVSRLTHQKMADILIEAIPAIAEAGAQVVLLGQGEPGYEDAFRELGLKHAGKLGVHIGYEDAHAHRLQAGSDMLLAPARFEPCGLTQLYALRYGTVPIVRRTGGLADTVADALNSDRAATGFVFDEPTLEGLLGAVNRSLAAYREPLAWRRMQLSGMAQDFSWNMSAARYAALYHDVSGIPYPTPPETKEPEFKGTGKAAIH